ncbi:DUF4366 domain-containing protein [Peptostreptococcus sp. D1]|uniref:DUF4366 domain-containing protein n=1 Tax=Peptostreptococcus sp. D1 TaxID=72304 RepID=UPI0008ED0643|nr:DUF4366 domain-containing protein [Peptostreptococcus sp. D1]SFE36063.1 protein of unknown function [Peptostreptococcus sp. D1]
MKNKRIFRTLTVLCAAVVLTCGFSVTAYAGGGEDIPTDDSNVIVETEPQPLTPEGNMSLVDDIQGDDAEDKQFIVVQSRGGDYFYIVIDKAAQGENTVHFLNQVDETDLLSIIEDGQTETPPAVCSCTDKCEAGSVNISCPVCSTNTSGCAGKEAVTAPEDEPQPEEKSGAGGLVIFLVVALLGGGGTLYYFKIMKPKQSVKGDTDLEDFDFEDYDEDEPEIDDLQDAADEEQEDDEV